jgi:hypothetical protein
MKRAKTRCGIGRIGWRGAPGSRCPETAVNDLFRANLWHALMLPRHRTDEHGMARIDLPYSNFAYGQLQRRLADQPGGLRGYMLHGLRGYFAVAEEEFAAMFHTSKSPMAGWAATRSGAFTPRHALFDRAKLPALRRSRVVRTVAARFPQGARLVPRGGGARSTLDRMHPVSSSLPLNDLSHDARAWAFPNAYFVAGLDLFGRALAPTEIPGRSRAGRGGAFAPDVERAFARASVQIAGRATGRRHLEQLRPVRCHDAAPFAGCGIRPTWTRARCISRAWRRLIRGLADHGLVARPRRQPLSPSMGHGQRTGL